MNKWAIFDIDGTISDDSSRIIYSPNCRISRRSTAASWEKYESLAPHDPPFFDTVEIIKAFKKVNVQIALVTARMAHMMDVTRAWTDGHKIPFDEIHFRKNDDFRPGGEVKRDIFLSHFQNREVIAVFEDKEDCIEMYRDLGLRVYDVGGGMER